jgi:hypothetical protein
MNQRPTEMLLTRVCVRNGRSTTGRKRTNGRHFGKKEKKERKEGPTRL